MTVRGGEQLRRSPARLRCCRMSSSLLRMQSDVRQRSTSSDHASSKEYHLAPRCSDGAPATRQPPRAGSRPRWPLSENRDRLFSDHAFVPIAARQSVHGMPVIAGPMELARRYRTSYQRPPGSHITSQERYKTTSILAFGMQAYAEPRRDGVTAAFRSMT